MKKKTFEERVRSMTAKQIIMAMVDGLKRPKTKIDMDSFGYTENGVCYGCAATNTICRIGKITLSADQIRGTSKHALALNGNDKFVTHFEYAIDNLRSGNVYGYNLYASESGFSEIEDTSEELPYLDTHNYRENLEPFVRLAEAQEEKQT